jgi:alpha-1,6-mannosyltransferase
MKLNASVISLSEGRPWMTNVTLCLFGLGLVLLTHQFVSESHHFTIGFSGCSGWSAILYIASIIVIFTQPTDRSTFWIVIGFSIAFRAMTLAADPFSSSDIYRYVWDGIVQHAHISPYRYVPGDPWLSFLRAPHQHIFDHINRRDYAHTIYPPVSQMIYWLVTLFSPTVLAMKVAMFGFECLTVVALVRLLRLLGRPSVHILLYAWCPLLVWEIAGAGHVDAAIFAFVTLAILFRYREQPVLTGVFLGLAVMTKFYPLVLLPALYKRGDWKMPATFLAICGLSYLPYLSVGKLVFGFLLGYTKEEGIDTGARFFLLEWVQSSSALKHLPVFVYLVFCAAVLGAISLWAWSRASGVSGDSWRAPSGTSPAFLRAAMLLAFAMMLLFSPHYSWYIVWLIPLFTLVPNFPLLVYLMVFFYLFTTALADPGPKMFLLNKILYSVSALAFLLHLAFRRWSVLVVATTPENVEQMSRSNLAKQLD